SKNMPFAPYVADPCTRILALCGGVPLGSAAGAGVGARIGRTEARPANRVTRRRLVVMCFLPSHQRRSTAVGHRSVDWAKVVYRPQGYRADREIGPTMGVFAFAPPTRLPGASTSPLLFRNEHVPNTSTASPS